MGMGVTGALEFLGGTDDKELYGEKVATPEFPKIEDSQLSAIKSNLAALPQIEDQASQLNRFNAAEIERMMLSAFPAEADVMSKSSALLKAQLGGEIPQDVQDQIARRAAERGIGRFGGSNSPGSITRYGEARNIGKTSYDITSQGLDNAGRWISMIRNNLAPIYDPTKMFLGPGDVFASDTQRFGRDLYAATMKAAPDPQARGSFDTEMGFLGEVLSAYSGGAGYQQTYKGPQSYGQVTGAGGGYNVSANGYGSAASSYIPAGGEYRGGAGPSYDYGGNNYGGWEDQGYSGGGGGGGGAGIAMAFV